MAVTETGHFSSRQYFDQGGNWHSNGSTVYIDGGSSMVRSGVVRQVGLARCKVGTTAGWTVNAANNIGTVATVAASQTNSTLVVPLHVNVGETITAIGISASINSAGNTVTLDCNLRSLTPAAGATATDASIASLTQISVTAATAVTPASLGSFTGLTTTVVSGTQYYLLLTATTGASTTIELDQIEVTVTTA